MLDIIGFELLDNVILENDKIKGCLSNTRLKNGQKVSINGVLYVVVSSFELDFKLYIRSGVLIISKKYKKLSNKGVVLSFVNDLGFGNVRLFLNCYFKNPLIINVVAKKSYYFNSFVTCRYFM